MHGFNLELIRSNGGQKSTGFGPTSAGMSNLELYYDMKFIAKSPFVRRESDQIRNQLIYDVSHEMQTRDGDIRFS